MIKEKTQWVIIADSNNPGGNSSVKIFNPLSANHVLAMNASNRLTPIKATVKLRLQSGADREYKLPSNYRYLASNVNGDDIVILMSSRRGIAVQIHRGGYASTYTLNDVLVGAVKYAVCVKEDKVYVASVVGNVCRLQQYPVKLNLDLSENSRSYYAYSQLMDMDQYIGLGDDLSLGII